MSTSSRRDTVVLVDERGDALGLSPKLAAHRPPGMLHLAISVFLYRRDGALLLQRRASTKYHFPGVWANACCSHPHPGETTIDAAVSRVDEELGLTVALVPAGAFVYRAECPSTGLVEREYDEVFIGTITGVPRPDPDEVAEIAWATVDEIGSGTFPVPLAPWFLPALELAEATRAISDQPLV